MTTDPMIEFSGVTKAYGETVAVDDISLSVGDGEFLALLGPSGSGKSTTLRMLAGFERPTAGRIELGGVDLTGVPPHKRDTSMVFQNYALFPHMTVGENIAFGLKRQNVPGDEIQDRIDEALSLVDLTGMADRRPGTLSGGQQQRVATARSIAVEPSVLLMDEPLGALDKQLRDQIKIDLTRLQNRLGITTVYVTHNQDEALTMADRIAVMNEGRIEQIGTPDEIYNRPTNRFVSDFIGDANFIHGTLTRRDDRTVLEAHGRELVVGSDRAIDGESVAFVRPEKMAVVSEPRAGQNAVEGRIEQILFAGSRTQYFVTVDDSEYLIEGEAGVDVAEGQTATVAWEPEHTHLVEA
jgi:spermidine/putrescine ABC transporter ATP-binding subunit